MPQCNIRAVGWVITQQQSSSTIKIHVRSRPNLRLKQPKNQSSPGRGGKTFEKHDVFRERAMEGESAFYHPVRENFGSYTDLARPGIMTQRQSSSIIEIMLARDPTYKTPIPSRVS